MKNSLIISLMLAAALQVSAQSTRSRTNSSTVEPAKRTETTHKAEKERSTDSRKAIREVSPASKPATPATPARSASQRRETASPAKPTAPATSTTPARPATQNRKTVRPAPSGGQTAPRTATLSTTVTRERSVTMENSKSATSRSARSVRGNEYTPATEKKYEQVRRTYETPARKKVVRTSYYNTGYVHRPIEYRRVHYSYRAPAVVQIYWSVPMYHEYRRLYPDYRYWYYPIGYRIHTVSAYDAGSYVGEIARIYGRVYSTWYSSATNEYYLYFGGPYPYQDFSIIIPRNIARRFSRRPELYFTNRDIAVTGLISSWEGKPELLLRERNQLEIY